MGIPRFLQVDNELLFRGSNRRPRSFGPLICLCFYLGVEIRIIPEGERWRNGFVERFNDINEKLSWQLRQFRDLANVREELPRFKIFQNTQHRYAKLRQRTP